MTDSSSGTPRSPLWNWLAGAIVLLAALRFVGLENDPPLYLVGHGQDQLTDPYHLTFHARNEILYGEWNPFAYHRWDVFKHSLVSAAAYVAFALGEPSRFWANLASTALNLAGLALFLAALLSLRGRRETLIAALLLLINSTLFFYARLPFLENGLIFLSGLTFFVLVRFNDKNWGLALTGALVALCGLIGKLFGFLLLGPVLLTLLYLHRRGCVKPALITLAGVAAGTIAVLALFYGGSLPTLVAYYSEQTVGMYGKPPGLASVGGFMTMFATYGGESGLAEFAPMLVLMPLVSVIVIALTTPEVFQRQREFVPLVFALIWLAVGVLGLMPFFYRPMRYSLFLFLPMSAICAYAINISFKQKLRLRLTNPKITVPVVFGVVFYAIVQVTMFVAPFGSKFKMGGRAVVPAFIAALLVAGMLYFWFRRTRALSSRAALLSLFGALLIAALSVQSVQLYRGLALPGAYLKQHNQDLSELIDSHAVVTGPYTPALTIDNELRGVIYMFGLTNVEKDLFQRFPITHVAVDRTNWNLALRDFPFLKPARKLAEMSVRDQVIALFRVPGADAPETDFERGVAFFDQGVYDSALTLFERFSSEYPENLHGKLRIISTRATQGDLASALTELGRILGEHPDNYMLHAFADGFYRNAHRITRDGQYQRLALFHRLKAQALNRKVALSP